MAHGRGSCSITGMTSKRPHPPRSQPPRGNDTRPAQRSDRPARTPAPAGLPARALAVEALDQILTHGAGLEEALDGLSDKLETRDRALAFHILATALRRIGTLRTVLGRLLERGLPKGSPRLEAVLLVGATQILYMDVPDHAAVGLSVDVARQDRSTAGFAGLVNAVLRRLTREKEQLLEGIDPFMTDTPDWLRTRWTTQWGEETARAISAMHRVEPPLDITVKSDPDKWAEALSGTVLPTGTVRVLQAGAVRNLPGFAEGEWWVQDAAAALPARLLGDVSGRDVADLCAAPGGKTAQLVQAGGRVTALDRSAIRLRRLQENLDRLNLKARVLEGDAGAFVGGPFDAILLDAPCTATGTLRRHPDIALTKRPGDIATLAALQARLLNHAADLLKPGGVLVYSTCSLEPEEGEEQIERLLKARKDLRRRPVRAEELARHDNAKAVEAVAAFITPQGDVRTLASHWMFDEAERSGLDGFFAARLERIP